MGIENSLIAPRPKSAPRTGLDSVITTASLQEQEQAKKEAQAQAEAQQAQQAQQAEAQQAQQPYTADQLIADIKASAPKINAHQSNAIREAYTTKLKENEQAAEKSLQATMGSMTFQKPAPPTAAPLNQGAQAMGDRTEQAQAMQGQGIDTQALRQAYEDKTKTIEQPVGDYTEAMVKRWAQERTLENADFFKNFGSLSPEAQSKYIDSVARSMAEQKVLPNLTEAQAQKAIRDVMSGSVYYKDLSAWQSVANGARNLGAGVMNTISATVSTGAGLISAAEDSRIAIGTGAKVLIQNGFNKLSGEKLVDYNTQYQADADNFFSNKIRDTARYFGDAHEANRGLYSEKLQSIMHGSEEARKESAWEGLKYDVTHPIALGATFIPDLAGSVVALLATRGASGAEVAANTMQQAFKQVGIPMGLYTAGSLARDMQPDKGALHPNQLTAIASASALSSVLNSLPVKYGVNLEALLAGVRNDAVKWASTNTALRIAQAVAVEVVTSAVDAGIQAGVMVAQGDKNNPYFSKQNIVDNAHEIYYALMLGGVLGGAASGGASAFTLRAAAKTHQLERALEAIQDLDLQGAAPPPEINPMFGDVSPFSDQVKSSLSELQVTLNEGVRTPDAIAYITEIAQIARGLIEDAQATLTESKKGDANIYTPTKDMLDQIITNPAAYIANVADKPATVAQDVPLLPAPKDTAELGFDGETAYLVGDYAIDGQPVKGGIANLEDGFDLVYDADSKAYVRQPIGDTTSATTLRPSDYNNTAYSVGDEVTLYDSNQTIQSAAPVYEKSTDGSYDYVGDFYVLRDNEGTDRPHFVPLEFNYKLRLGDGVRHYNSNHSNQATPSIEVRRGDERFEGDQEYFADQATARRAAGQLDDVAARGREEAAESQAEAERLNELHDIPMIDGSDQIDYLAAVTPSMFANPSVSKVIMTALRSGSEQEVINALNRIVYSFKPPKKTNSIQAKQLAEDQSTALSLLKGNGHAVSIIAEHNSNYIIPLSSELMQLVDHTVMSTPEIKAQPTSLLTDSITWDSKTMTTEEQAMAATINRLLYNALSLEELNALTHEQLSLILKRVYPHEVPKVAAELLIYADMNRPSTVSHSQYIADTIRTITDDPYYPQEKKAVILSQVPLIEKIALEFDARTQYMQPNDAMKMAAHTNDTTLSYIEAMPFTTSISLAPFTHLSYLYNAEGIPQKVSQILMEREKIRATDISSEVIQTKILGEGLLAPEVRYVKYWESSEAKAMMKGLRTEESISKALYDIQLLAREPVIADSALGRDIYRATAILELANVALANVALPTDRVGVSVPSGDNVSVRTFAPSVTPLQAAINEALFSRGDFINDTPVMATAKIDYSSNQVELNLALEDRVTKQVLSDLELETIAELSEVGAAYVDAVVEYNHLVRELIELDTAHDAGTEQLATLEAVKIAEGTTTKLEQSLQSAHDQLNVVRSAIAERQVQRLRTLEKINSLRETEPQLYSAHPENNFYQPPRIDEATLKSNDEVNQIINGEKDYADSFIDSAVDAAQVGISSETLINTVKAKMLKRTKEVRSVLNYILGVRETIAPDAWDYRSQPLRLAKDQLSLLRSLDPVVREKIGRDAVHDVSNRILTPENLTQTLHDFSLMDEGLGINTTELIRNYVSDEGASRGLLLSQIDEFNFDGVYPKASRKLNIDSEGFASIDSMQAYFAAILKANGGFITADGMRAQAYLNAITAARTLRTSMTGISYANPNFKVGSSTANQAHTIVGDALRNGTLKDALTAIYNLNGLDPNLQRTAKFLLSTYHRFGDGILVKIDDPNGNTEAEYNFTTNTITFKGEAENIPYYVLHEVAHGLLDALYQVNENALTATQLTAKKALQEIYKYALQEGKLTNYAKTGEREFFAEAMSNYEQAQLLHDLSTDDLTARGGYVHLNRIRDLYDYFVDKIRGLFGWDTLRTSKKRAAEQQKNGQPVDTVHTALSDIMSAVHLYSKPTHNKAASGKRNNQGNTVKAVTPAGEYVSGIDEVTEVIFVRDTRVRFGRNHIAGAITPTGARNRYELVLYGVDQKQRIIGTLPQIKQQLNDTVGRYDFAEHINLKGTLSNPTLAAKNIDYLIRLEHYKDKGVADPHGLAYSEQLSTIYLNGIESAPLPDFVTRPILAYMRNVINNDIRKYRNKDGSLVKGVGAPLDNFNQLPVLARLIRAVVTGLNFLTQIPRTSSILDTLDVLNKNVTDSKDIQTLFNRGLITDGEQTTLENMRKVNLLAAHQQSLGARTAYAQSRNSKLYQLHQEIQKLLPNATDLEEFSVWRTYKHAIERDLYHANHIRAGESKPTHFTGAQYAGKTGLEASKQIVSEIEARLSPQMKVKYEAAHKLLQAEQQRLLRLQLNTGYIDYATYAKFHTYDYYMPLLNRTGDAETKNKSLSDPSTLQGRDTPPKHGYSSLMQYFNEAQGELQLNTFKQYLAAQLERDMGTGVVNVAQGEIRIVDSKSDNMIMRTTPPNEMAEGVYTYRSGGKEFTLKVNDTTSRGKALKRYLDSLEPINPYLKGDTFDAIKSFIRASTVLSALTAVVASPNFILKTLGWNSFMPLANTQASYKVNTKDAMKISVGTYAYYLKNIAKLPSITSTQLGGTNANPMFALYQQQGGGLIGHALGGQELMDFRFGNPSIANALSGGEALQSRFNHPLPETQEGRASLLADYAKHRTDNAINFLGDFSNIPDAIVRFSSWESAVSQLGTDKMKQALRDGDVDLMRSELEANPHLQAQFNAGSKQIIGNFQEQSALRRFAPYYMFLNAGMQGVSLVERMLRTPQGLLAWGAAMTIGALMARGYSDDTGLDGKDKYVRDRGANTGIQFDFNGTPFRIELDYSLRPAYAAGMQLMGYASGELTATEAWTMFGSVASDTFVPISGSDIRGGTSFLSASNSTDLMNSATALAPTPLRSIAFPLFYGTTNYSNNVDGTAYDSAGNRLAGGQPQEAYLSTSPIANSIASVIPYASGARTHAVLQSFAGEPYRLLNAYTNPSLSAEDRLQYTFRSYLPEQQDIYRYRNDLDKLLNSITKQQYYATSDPNYPDAAFIKRISEQAPKIQARFNRITSDNGNGAGKIRFHRQRATSDAERIKWNDEYKSLVFNQQSYAAQMIAEIEAEQARSAGSPTEARERMNALREARKKYRNADEKIDLLKVVGR